MAGDRSWESTRPPVSSNQLANALAGPADPLGDLASSEPVVVLCHSEGPSTDASTPLNVVDRRQNSVLLGFCRTVEQAQHAAVSLKRERGVIAASLEEGVQLRVGEVEASEGQSKGPLSHRSTSSAS